MQIAVGDEGYMVGGTDWIDNGSKGDDWVGNLQDPNIAFGTVHLCARAPRPPALRRRWCRHLCTRALHCTHAHNCLMAALLQTWQSCVSAS